MKEITKNNDDGNRKLRESNLELFRIITMLLIVAHHYVVNSGLLERIYQSPMALRSLFLLVFGAWGKTGINCFLLITGYFMCKSRISAQKFFKLVAEVILYRVVLYVIFAMTGYDTFSLMGLIRAFMPPITVIQQNFTGCYLVFFLFIPYLNILIQNMSEKLHIILILLVGFTYIFWGTLRSENVTMNYVSWYMVCYVIAAYIRMYPKHIFSNTRFWGGMTSGCLIVSSISVIFCAWYFARTGKRNIYYFVSDCNKLFAVATAVSAFLFFKNMKMKYNRLVNTIAASTFGVLQIHANSDTMRRWLWQDMLNNVNMYDSRWLVVHAVGSVIVVFLICTGIDYLRIQYLEKTVRKITWNLYQRKHNCV